MKRWTFTKWLEGNIDVLSELLVLVLTIVDREQDAGDFSVDLIAEDSQGEAVIIKKPAREERPRPPWKAVDLPLRDGGEDRHLDSRRATPGACQGSWVAQRERPCTVFTS